MEQQENKQPFNKKLTWVVLILVLLFVVVMSGKGTATPPSSTPSQQAQPKLISYQITDRWTITNGGEGKVVVISPDLVNETDMVALGGKLKSDTQNDRNAFIFVFDDASAAALRSKVLSDKATTAEQDLYDKHFIGNYTKNANTGFHQFVINFDGVMGKKQKTKKKQILE